jgi:nicotinamidase-related amidase
MITALDKNTALVLIDLQKGIVQIPTAHPVKEILINAAKLTEAFHKAGLPVIIVNVQPAATVGPLLRKDIKPMGNNNFQEEWLEIAPEIKSQLGDIFITKPTWSAFYETSLDDELQKKNITGIVLAGIATSIGVEGTARAANERGYNISFAVDAMTGRSVEAHDRSVQFIFSRMGEVGDTEAIIELLPFL